MIVESNLTSFPKFGRSLTNHVYPAALMPEVSASTHGQDYLEKAFLITLGIRGNDYRMHRMARSHHN